MKDYCSEKLTVREWLISLSQTSYVDVIENEVVILPIRDDRT